MENTELKIPDDIVISKIYYIRDQKVMFDSDLAALYEVETKQLKRQVRRNIERFPEDFMFESTPEESRNSRSQNGTLKQGGNIKYAPMVFTEQGVAMLSSVLNSSRAIPVLGFIGCIIMSVSLPIEVILVGIGLLIAGFVLRLIFHSIWK